MLPCWIEHKQLPVRLRRAKEGIQIDDEISRQCCGASRMKDSQPGIIVHDQGVLREWFATVRAPFRETLNACPLSVFIGEDEHDILLSDRPGTSMSARSRSVRKVYLSCPMH
jgi:hypothetical protein